LSHVLVRKEINIIVKVWRSIVGSVTNFVLRRADCPVVICRDPVSIERQRHISCVDREKVRRRSGESITSRIRHRFASGSQCLPSRDDSERLFLGEWEDGDRSDEMRI